MPAFNSLVTQQSNTEPPQVQGTDTQQPSGAGLQSAVGQGPQQSFQAPSHQEAVALLQHMSAFRRRWMQMLQDPEIGQKDMRGDVQDMMADMMSDDYASLPEVMGVLKQIPTNPLEQKQWIEKHIQNDEQAMEIVLRHYAATRPPPGDFASEMAASPPVTDDSRADLVKSAVGRYKAHSKQRSSSMRIPVNA